MTQRSIAWRDARLICFAVGYIAAGTVQTLSLKWADGLSATDRFTPQRVSGLPLEADGMGMDLLYTFAHPLSQILFMFCGEVLCLVVLAARLFYIRFCAPISPLQEYGRRSLVPGKDYALPCNPCVWLLPAGADFLGSIIQNIGITMTYASVYQMLRGATVVWIALISFTWLGRRFGKVELWGVLCVVVGLSMVGLCSLIPGKDAVEDRETANQILGNTLIVLAQILHAYQGVCEERLVHLYRIPPMQMVGMEGLYGVGLSLTFLALLRSVPTAKWGHNLTGLRMYYSLANESDGSASMERTVHTVVYTNVSWIKEAASTDARVPYDDIILLFDQLRSSSVCLISILLYTFSGFFYNSCQMHIIQRLSAASTVMLGTLRNITVWMACLLIPSVFAERFAILQCFGFLFLVLGNVLFQRVWIKSFDEILPVRLINACPLLFLDAPATEELPVVEEFPEELSTSFRRTE